MVLPRLPDGHKWGVRSLEDPYPDWITFVVGYFGMLVPGSRACLVGIGHGCVPDALAKGSAFQQLSTVWCFEPNAHRAENARGIEFWIDNLHICLKDEPSPDARYLSQVDFLIINCDGAYADATWAMWMASAPSMSLAIQFPPNIEGTRIPWLQGLASDNGASVFRLSLPNVPPALGAVKGSVVPAMLQLVERIAYDVGDQ